ncbi:MAG: ATP-binding protein, partial [Clostridiales Family XIII bacterium]|nr:ATP-binding protein [Clostridiales Family XIII bacterium]
MGEAKIIKSAGLNGISGLEVIVETSISNGLPGFVIVGLPDNSVQESRERVRAVLKNIGFDFPMRRILVNLAPADTRKAGPLYDLPIALGVLTASGQMDSAPENAVFVGELSLDGELRPVKGVLPMALSASAYGAKSIFVPKENAREASLAGNLAVYPVGHINEIIAHLREESGIAPAPPYAAEPVETENLDFADVRGQESVRRALEVAVSGAHNILLTGPAGSGKSMMASRIPSILPQMTRQEMISATAIHSIAGLTCKSAPLLRRPPFRSPHHTIS